MSFVRPKPAQGSFCVPVLTNAQDIKPRRTSHSLFWGHFILSSAKHNNKALITSRPLLRFFFNLRIIHRVSWRYSCLFLPHRQEQPCVESRWLDPTGLLWLPSRTWCCSDRHLCDFPKLCINYCDITPVIQLGLKCLRESLLLKERLGGWWETWTCGMLGDPRACFS